MTLEPVGQNDVPDDIDPHTLTKLIRENLEAALDCVESVCFLLRRAQELGTHTQLGYSSWGEYVNAEFEMSRQRSYQLLKKANVLLEIEAGTGVTVTTPLTHIPEWATRQIQPGDVPTIVETIKEQTASVTDMREKAAVASEVIHRAVQQAHERKVSTESAADFVDAVLDDVEIVDGEIVDEPAPKPPKKLTQKEKDELDNAHRRKNAEECYRILTLVHDEDYLGYFDTAELQVLVPLTLSVHNQLRTELTVALERDRRP